MDTYFTAFTAHPAYPLGRWLATLAVSLVLLALAYAQAPDPAGQLGFRAPSVRTLAKSRPVPSQAPIVASARLRQPTGMASPAQFGR